MLLLGALHYWGLRDGEGWSNSHLFDRYTNNMVPALKDSCILVRLVSHVSVPQIWFSWSSLTAFAFVKQKLLFFVLYQMIYFLDLSLWSIDEGQLLAAQYEPDVMSADHCCCGWLILLATRGQWPLEVYILFANLDFSIIQLLKKQSTVWRLMLARRQAMSTWWDSNSHTQLTNLLILAYKEHLNFLLCPVVCWLFYILLDAFHLRPL